MLERILERYRATDWDFRKIASPADPLSVRFSQWVDYYRLKVAIAAALQPASILEIGVRYGYSYAAFKQGHPGARFFGIDLDADTFGGQRGAIEWARQLARGTDDDFLVGDSQKMGRLPGGTYDLIHIDGQQDGQGSYHDLELAIAQGRWLLVDGYLWTRDNCLSISDFLLRYRHAVEYALVIPGYAGELLIKVDPAHLERESRRPHGTAGAGSESAREHYTAAYYLRECGGWDEFERYGAQRLVNTRLQTLLDLALQGSPRRLLDLGCGRGEITYQAARHGVEVTAVDYSPAAIEIAKTCFAGEPELEKRVEWICGSAADLRLEGEYDAVVAGGLVERMSEAELERTYATVSRHLAAGGRLIVHTSPSAWFYRYHYARQRRAAGRLGAYLPAEPRSRYEKLMHINEQSPRVLRRQLRRHFPEALLWFANPEESAGSLGRPVRGRELAACRDLYAVASPTGVDGDELLEVLQMQPLTTEQVRGVSWALRECPATVGPGAAFTVAVDVQNRTRAVLHSRPPNPVNLCYHWRDAATGATVIHDGLRSPVSPACFPDAPEEYTATVHAPEQPGRYRLEITLVQEGVRWFEEVCPEMIAVREMEIVL